MELIKSTFSRISFRPIGANQHYVDDESREYSSDEQRQGFLGPKEEGESAEFKNTSVNSTNQPYSVSIYRVVALVIAAVVLTAAVSLFFVRSTVLQPIKIGNYQDVSKHATEVLTDLVAHAEPPQFRMKSPCGSTPEEAKARGCHFDTISFCWLPSECYDSELVGTFESTRNWHYYADPEGKRIISHEELVGGHGNHLWVSWEYHLRHCAYMWFKFQRAVLARGNPEFAQVDSYIASLNHTVHCSEILLTDRDVAFPTLNTETLVKYPDCGLVWV